MEGTPLKERYSKRSSEEMAIPVAKKANISLEISMLHCVVCHDLPSSSIMQVTL